MVRWIVKLSPRDYRSVTNFFKQLTVKTNKHPETWADFYLNNKEISNNKKSILELKMR